MQNTQYLHIDPPPVECNLTPYKSDMFCKPLFLKAKIVFKKILRKTMLQPASKFLMITVS